MKKKEAIELLESYENKLVYEISEKDKIAIKTILNLIEKKDKRINKLEKALIDDDYKHRKEIEKKDKTIYKMAKAINSYDIDEDICKQMGQKKDCSDYAEEGECERCIKEYFEKKEEE